MHDTAINSSTRYYTPAHVLLGSLLGGPIAGGYLVSRNHALFGAPRRALIALLVSGVVLLGVFALGLLAPQASRILPPIIIAILYRSYAEHKFSQPIARSLEQGWMPYSWWRVVGITIVLFLSSIILLFLVLLVLPDRWVPT
jgi:hypothetical protein